MFKIEITEVTEKEALQTGRWGVVDKRPFTEKELAEANRPFQTTIGAIKEVMGYLPSLMTKEKVSRVILLQEAEEIDIKAVIKAINGIE